MSAGRTVAVVLLGVLLLATFAAGNVVFAAHSSVLDPGFVTSTMEEEDGYEALTQEMQRAVENATTQASGGGYEATAFGSLLEDDPVEAAVTPSYVKSQVEPNVDELYAYLHGNSERLNLTLDARPLAENAGESVADSIRNATVTELVEAAPGDPFADVPVDETFVQRLNEDRTTYQSAKQDLRDRVREPILDAAVEEAFSEASNDERLALVIPDYDPRDYSEAEKERMVDDREGEIRRAIRQRIERERGDEIDAAVQDQLDAFRQQAAGTQPSAEAMGTEAIAGAAGDLEMAVVTAATTDQSYETYRENVTSARDDLATAVNDYVVTQFSEEAGVVDLNEQLNVQEEGEFAGARSMVGYMDLSAIVLPILALLLIAAVWFVSRSIVTTAATVGASLLLAAIPTLVGAPIAGDRLRSMIEIEGDAAASMRPIVEGLIDRVVATLTGQSLLLAVFGLALVVLAIALHYDAYERITQRRGAR